MSGIVAYSITGMTISLQLGVIYTYVTFLGQTTDPVDSDLAPIISYTYQEKHRRNMKDDDETPTFQDYGVSQAECLRSRVTAGLCAY